MYEHEAYDHELSISAASVRQDERREIETTGEAGRADRSARGPIVPHLSQLI